MHRGHTWEVDPNYFCSINMYCYCDSETSSLHGSVNSGTPGDSKHGFLHCEDVFAESRGLTPENWQEANQVRVRCSCLSSAPHCNSRAHGGILGSTYLVVLSGGEDIGAGNAASRAYFHAAQLASWMWRRWSASGPAAPLAAPPG